MKYHRLVLFAALIGCGLSAIPSAQARCGACYPPNVRGEDNVCRAPGGDEVKTPDTPDAPTTFTPINYSTNTSTTNGRFQGATIGNMSDGLGGGTAKVAEKGLAGVGKTAWCNRGGRSKTMVDACLKAAGG